MTHKHLSQLGESHDAADAWHTHSADEHPQEAHGEVLAVPTVLAYGTACFLIVVVAVVATTVYFYSYTHALAGERMEHFDANAPDDKKIQAEYNAHRQKAEAEVLKGLRGDGGAFEKITAQYAAKRSN